MAKYSQADRPFKIKTSLGEDVLLLERFEGEESISTPYTFNLSLVSEDDSIAAEAILRTPASLTIQLFGGDRRVIHGLIRRFVQLEQRDELTLYRAELVPWLWFLSLSNECRIFQEKSVLEIVEDVFKTQGYSDFQIRCTRNYPKRQYCVQYRESHLAFVSRLLEEEGIYYFFEHSSDKHILVLADDTSAIKSCPGQTTARMAEQPDPWQSEDVVTRLQWEQVVHTGKVTLRDYDYLQPSLQLESAISGHQPEEIYDYPGKYTRLDEGERYARLRLEAHEAIRQVARGAGSCRSFQPGYRFELRKHYRKDLNQAYQLLTVRHRGSNGDLRAWESTQPEYRNEFIAIPHGVPYRPPLRTPKPVVQGSQAALVVGKAGEEIWVDKYGRVKVQFYWDRERKKDENSSCWVRVSSSWAGKGWGVIQIPRIGQEVIVDFLEGDPDRPIITGRVYNAEQAPPYELPAHQTQSGMKSRSSKRGSTENFNEIRMEDLKGNELLYIHAERDKEVVVENDRAKKVGHDERTSIGNDRTESVGANESISIEKNRTESVGGNENITIVGNRADSVQKDETIQIGGNRRETVTKNEDLTIGGDRIHQVKKSDELNVGKDLIISAGNSVLIKTGAASILMKRNGDIRIKGKNIKVQGSAKIQISASSEVNIKGSKVTNN